jgi:hypothetical protein
MRHDRRLARGRVVVAAQWDPVFMAEAERWRAAPCRATCFDGADTDRAGLFAALRPGDTLVYLGHATPRAWLGFRGIRADHLPPLTAPLACVIALTCHGTAPDGVAAAWVDKGLAHAATGPRGPVATDLLLRVAADLRDLFGARKPDTAGRTAADVAARAQRAGADFGLLFSAPCRV